jgi:hypothetical protein
MRDRGVRFPSLHASSIGALLVVLFAALLDQGRLHGQSPDLKLSTRLADLADAIPQDDGRGLPSPQSTRPVSLSSLPQAVQDAVRSSQLRLNDRSEVQVYILVREVTDDVVRQIMATGARVEIADEPSRRVQAHVPVTRLRLVAALPFVDYVRLPTYAYHTRIGSALTEGDAIHNADVARRQFGLDGTGIKVGVISDGIKGIFAKACTTCGGASGGPIATGDLPDATGTRSLLTGILTSSSGGITGQSFTANRDLEGTPPAGCAFGGAGAEGTALLEIVHDVAPGAQLSFANIDTDLAFNQAVNALAAVNDVVIDDLGFFGEASDGTSRVSSNTAAALNNNANRIRTYVTSVGNAADEHYFGTYVNSGVDGTTLTGIATPGRLHLFQRTAETTDVLGIGDQPFNVINLPAGGEVVIFLNWDDTAGRSANNYDMYLVRDSTNTVVARSTDRQTGTQDPLEVIDFTNTGAAGLFHIVIQNVNDQAQPRALNLFSFQPQCAADGPRPLVIGRHERHNFNTASRSVTAQSDSGGSPVSVISVGAICSGSPAAQNVFSTPNESCSDRDHRTIEFFSSRGPTSDGRQKPDISAIDGVEVTGSGGFVNPFFGTSASAPHVAAQAALVLQGAPCLTSAGPAAAEPATARAKLRTLVISTATPLSAVPDNVFGAGLANVFASVDRTLPVRTGPAAVVVGANSAAGARVAPSDLGFADPNQCDVRFLRWTGGCGASPAPAMICPAGNTTIDVAASNNGVAFSTASTINVTVTSFDMSSTPDTTSIAPGESATFHVTLTPVGGPYPSPIALSCASLPPGSTCTFNPPTITPGGQPAESVLTIATTPRPGAPGVAMIVVLGLAVAAVGVWRKNDFGNRFAFLRNDSRNHFLAIAIVTVSISCRGGSGSNNGLTVSPASLTFASQVTQTTSGGQTVSVRNGTDGAVAISSITSSGDFTQTNTCAATLPAGGNCSITVVFTPTANGARTGSLTVVTDAPGSPHTVALTGTGTAPANGTPAGTFQVSIRGTVGTLVNSTQATLTVR